MIVCLCFGQRESDIHREIASGARSVDEVGERCRAGTGCGTCRATIGDMIDAHDPPGCASCPMLAPEPD